MFIYRFFLNFAAFPLGLLLMIRCLKGTEDWADFWQRFGKPVAMKRPAPLGAVIAARAVQGIKVKCNRISGLHDIFDDVHALCIRIGHGLVEIAIGIKVLF